MRSYCTDAENQTTVQFSVTDTGIGIAADKLDKILNGIHRQLLIHRASITVEPGLGLTITKHLIELQGGKHTGIKYGRGGYYFLCGTYLYE